LRFSPFFREIYFCLISSILCTSSFLIITPPPRSTLFPYTTLFRSDRKVDALGRPVLRERRRQRHPERDRREGPDHFDQPLDEVIDRKSTRLNSSHGSISYAVFCLKKKKNTI